jgi:methionine-S-sulfoxide reductase
VLEVTSGYAGGHTSNPSYHDVCSKETGHAEVVLVEFDPQVISYEQLLRQFWKMHDYTRRNREGWQYRNAIFVQNASQREIAERTKREVSTKEVTTFIEPATIFWPAEDYHQRYYEKHGFAGCRL